MDESNILVLGDLDHYTAELPDPSLLLFYKNLDERRIWINQEIDNDLMDLVNYIIRWNAEDKDLPVEERRPIKILLNSVGGSLSVSEALRTVIKMSKTPVYGYAIGITDSGASLIYSGCHKRYALATATFMLHHGSCQNMSGSYDEVQNFMDDYKKTIERLELAYMEVLNYDAETVHKNMTSDWYIRNPECVECGLVHEIIDNIDVLL